MTKGAVLIWTACCSTPWASERPGCAVSAQPGPDARAGLNEILFSMSMEQGAEYLHTHYALPQSAAEVGAGIADMLRDFYFMRSPPNPARRRCWPP